MSLDRIFFKRSRSFELSCRIYVMTNLVVYIQANGLWAVSEPLAWMNQGRL